MRVLFDAYWWEEGPPSGRNVVRSLLTAWAERFDEDTIVAGVPVQDLDAASRSLPSTVRPLGLRLRPHAAAASVELATIARRHHPDLTVAQNFTPVWGRSAVFLHDVLFQSNPEWFTPAERAYFAAMPWLARRAAVVLTSSQAEAERITRHNPRLRPTPVGLGLSPALVQGPERPPVGVEDLSGFVLSAGRLNVRKNLERTVAAAARSREVHPLRPLLVVGESQGRTESSTNAGSATSDGTVRMLGHLPDEELRWLYRHADLFAFLSLDEGYGLPPLEARANGCPVLASDIPVLRETLGAEAEFVDPTDVEAIADAMDRALVRPADGSRSARVRQPSLLSPDWNTVVERIRAAAQQPAEVPR